MNKNITTITIVLLTLFIGTAFSAIDIDPLAVYDSNGDGIIDAEERIALDIDIENCRVDFDESAFADQLTTDGSIILSDELQRVALYHGTEDKVTEIVLESEPAVESESTVEPTSESTLIFEPAVESTDEPSVEISNITYIILGIIIVVGIYYLLGKKGDGKKGEKDE